MRLLIIAERDDHRLVVRKHIEIEWPDAIIAEHRWRLDPEFDPQFAAVGFDAVIMVGSMPTLAIESFASSLSSKVEFAPIVLVLLENLPDDPPLPVNASQGLQRLYGKKNKPRAIGCLDLARCKRAP